MPPLSVPTKLLLMALGWVSFALGLIGIFVPLLPTTIFWIIAVWCWLRSAPALAERVYRHPRLGPSVKSFIENGEMSRRAKYCALGGMLFGYLVWSLLFTPATRPMLLVGLAMAAVGAWLARRPEPPRCDTRDNCSPIDTLK